MNIMLIDDDEAIRMMLQDIIEDYELGTVSQSLPSAVNLSAAQLSAIDILIIDLLMPGIDGIEAVRRLKGGFAGKIIMLSQVESKDMVGKAYENGIDYYITKPLNRNEIVSVLRSVSEHLRLESFAQNLQNSLQNLTPKAPMTMTAAPKLTSQQRCDTALKELGILSSPAAPDLSDIISYIAQNNGQLPALKNLFSAVAQKRQAPEPEKEAKAMEQRLRRAIFQAHVNIATMGSLDYTNPRFEELAPLYFDYNDIRNTMRLLENDEKPAISQVHINTKKFIHALYDTVYSR